MKRIAGKLSAFNIINYTFLSFLSVLSILPVIHMLSMSLSSSNAAAAGYVSVFPINFTINTYKYVLMKNEFFTAFFISIERVLLGGAANLLLAVLIAYPLSKEKSKFRYRTVYAWYFIITTIFSGGLIPTFMVIRELKLIDSIWALILPCAVPVFSAVLLLNFFRSLPKELEESAAIDGAGHLRVLFKIVIPLSPAALATVSLFAVVFHWNSWFDGIIYVNSSSKYPLQSYLQTIMNKPNPLTMSFLMLKEWAVISDRTIKAAQVFLAALPILAIYPFLQRYFVKGVVLGSVKG
jgi:putative aldouronate transport system permease protein